MDSLPDGIMHVLKAFEPGFSARVWEHVKVLEAGAILAPGKRTVTSVLRVMGLGQERLFGNYHRVLNRATWSIWAMSGILLKLLVAAFVAEDEPIVIGLDDHIERRRGAKIAAKGIYRHQLWPVTMSCISPAEPDIVKIPKSLFDRLTDTLAFAA